jgi:hypothetical protein
MKRIALFSVLFWLIMLLSAQTPVVNFSEWLRLDTSFVLENLRREAGQRNWVATVYQNNFCFCQRKAFFPHDKAYRCVIHRVDINNWKQDSLCISYPQLGSSWKREVQGCCVYALSFEKDKLLLVCDNQLLLYQRNSQGYNFVKRLLCLGVCNGYIFENRVYALVDDKERGLFRWICYENEKDQKGHVVRELPQPAPFLLQFDPKRYLFVNEQYLYYLPPGNCVVKKYGLRGDLLDSVSFDIPGWNPFPQDFLEHLRALPYGTERIFYALGNQYRQYSFVKTVDPINDSLLLLSVNLGNCNTQRQLAILRMRKTASGWQQELSTLAEFDTSRKYLAGSFPASFHLSADNLQVYPHHNSLLQLVEAPEREAYDGLSVKQYQTYKNQWFKDHDPVVKLRVQHVKKECAFLDYDNTSLSLDAFKQDKLILVVNQQPQCSTCQKHLLQFLSSVDTAQVAVACFMGQVGSYLVRRQQLQQLDEICPRFYQPLYAVENEDYGLYTSCNSYPAIFFWQRGYGVVGAYATEDIFTADYNRYEFSESFLNDFSHFVSVDK